MSGKQIYYVIYAIKNMIAFEMITNTHILDTSDDGIYRLACGSYSSDEYLQNKKEFIVWTVWQEYAEKEFANRYKSNSQSISTTVTDDLMNDLYENSSIAGNTISEKKTLHDHKSNIKVSILKNATVAPGATIKIGSINFGNY
jgi:hypothetical protein